MESRLRYKDKFVDKSVRQANKIFKSAQKNAVFMSTVSILVEGWIVPRILYFGYS